MTTQFRGRAAMGAAAGLALATCLLAAPDDQRTDASGGNPAVAPNNNPGTKGSELGRETAADSSSNGAENRKSGSSFFHFGREEVMENRPEKRASGERGKAKEESEVSKKFETTLLYAGITPAPSATPNAKQGPTNNPGVDHTSLQELTSSETGRSTAEAGRSDTKTSPESSVSPVTTQLRLGGSPAESPGVSPIPSSSPSATVTVNR
jgi:hypothetical protein